MPNSDPVATDSGFSEPLRLHYLGGYCSNLAAALWSVLQWEDGWGLVELDDGSGFGHVVLHHGDVYLDAAGLHTETALRVRYPAMTLRSSSPALLDAGGWSLLYEDGDLVVARVLLRRLGLDAPDLDWDRAAEDTEDPIYLRDLRRDISALRTELTAG